MRYSLLATSRGSGAVVDPPPDAGDTYDLYSTAMPNVHTAVVLVGLTRTYTTVAAGIAAAGAMVSGTQRALVVVDAGTYNEQVSTLAYVDLVGATGDPADVVIEHACPTGGSPITTTGGPVWIGGLTIRLIPYPGRVGSGVYGVHHRGALMTIFERVIFDTTDGIGAIGMDGDSGSATWIIDCTFANTDESTGLGTNMHGTGTNTSPLTLVYDNCDTNGLGVNYNALGSGQADEVYVQGGSVPDVNISAGVGVLAFVDPAIPAVTAGAGVILTRDTTLPERPLRGV